jgi:fatty-acyl-CoA synthase
MSANIVSGNSMDDYQLGLTGIVERAERFHADQEVVSRRPSGAVDRTTFGACATRARRLAGALSALGVSEGDRVATLLWNQAEHLELYFAVPTMGAVVHTLNPRLFPDELAFIVNDAQDGVIVVDESLLEVFESFRTARDFTHVVVVTHTGEAPAGMLDYESLVAGAEPVEWPMSDERRAAAMCYTSGTTGRPKGVVYSHRALVLHSLVAALPDQLAVSARDTILPVVPMFHANAWGLPYAAALAGARLVLPARASIRKACSSYALMST